MELFFQKKMPQFLYMFHYSNLNLNSFQLLCDRLSKILKHLIWYIICIFRISLSDDDYHVIKPPVDSTPDHYGNPYMGRSWINNSYLDKSEKGAYLLSVDYRIRIWILGESCGQMDWTMKQDIELKHVLSHFRFDQHVHGPWVDINCEFFRSSLAKFKEEAEQSFEWNSDNDDSIDTGYEPEESYPFR